MRISLYLTSCLIVTALSLTSCSSSEEVPSSQPNGKQIAAPSETQVEITEDSTVSAKEIEAQIVETPSEKKPESGIAIAKVEKTPEQGVAKKVSRKSSEKKTKKRKKRSAIKFQQPTFNYGEIQQGDKVEHQFYFTNTGQTPLTITNVKASCGCTQPSFPFIPIEPGEKGYIGVVFDSKGKLGKQKPIITVNTNAYPPAYKLYLEGFVNAGPSSDDASVITKKPSEEQ